MKKAMGLAVAVLAASVIAASAQGSQTSSAAKLANAAFSCSKTITLPLVTPVTGGAAPTRNHKTAYWSVVPARSSGSNNSPVLSAHWRSNSACRSRRPTSILPIARPC